MPDIGTWVMENQGPVIVITICGFPLMILIFASAVARRAVWGDPEIRKRGIPAQAQILRTWDTGTSFSSGLLVQVGMELQVHPPSSSPYRTKAKAVIPEVNLPLFQPGVHVPIKIHPTKPDKVQLEIYKSGAAGGEGFLHVLGVGSVQIDVEALGEASVAGSKTLSQRLDEVEQAHNAGLLTDDQYERKRKQIIDAA